MKNRNIFQEFWFVRSNYNSKHISTCCGKSDALPHDELRAVASVKIESYTEHYHGDNWSRIQREMDQDRILVS